MDSLENEGNEYETNRVLLYNRMVQDGKLVSPIDLSLESTHHIAFEKLEWVNVDDPPAKMRLNNSGETMIVSGKWDKERPYLSGGPLMGPYVFSQIHFHWGSGEHEGSEHTVGGVCYPMEVHVVFYKARYLTQNAALKHDDGVVIVVYLVKLLEKTTPGLHWVISHSEKVTQPQTSTLLPPTPLSSLCVPFSNDYLMYWGSLETSHCAHTMLWIVSRAALGVTVEDLVKLRSLLNIKKEPMIKNFRGTNSRQDRKIFHINPSAEVQHLLMSGMIDPPCKVLLVNYLQMPSANKPQAKSIFNRGDGTSERSEKMSIETKESIKKVKSKADLESYTFCEGNDLNILNNETMTEVNTNSIIKHNSEEVNSLKTKIRSRITRDEILNQTRIAKKMQTAKRKEFENCRRQEAINKSNETAISEIKNLKKTVSEKGSLDKNLYVHQDISHISSNFTLNDKTENLKSKVSKDVSNEENRNNLEKTKPKSRLPVPKKVLKSSIAQYFQRPDSAPNNIRRQLKPATPKLSQDVKRIPAAKIPKPLGRNAGKLDGSFEEKIDTIPRNSHFVRKRPTSSPTKAIQ